MMTFEEQMEFNEKRSPESEKRLDDYYHAADKLADDGKTVVDFDDKNPARQQEFIKFAKLWYKELQGLTEEQYQKDLKSSNENELQFLLVMMYG